MPYLPTEAPQWPMSTTTQTARAAVMHRQEEPMDMSTVARLPLWIGGRAVPARTTRYGEVTNPATGEVLRHVPFATREDVDDAVRAASAAWDAWRAAPAL